MPAAGAAGFVIDDTGVADGAALVEVDVEDHGADRPIAPGGRPAGRHLALQGGDELGLDALNDAVRGRLNSALATRFGDCLDCRRRRRDGLEEFIWA